MGIKNTGLPFVKRVGFLPQQIIYFIILIQKLPKLATMVVFLPSVLNKLLNFIIFTANLLFN
jgi:hypothetical protein